jgi:hypothetical protein
VPNLWMFSVASPQRGLAFDFDVSPEMGLPASKHDNMPHVRATPDSERRADINYVGEGQKRTYRPLQTLVGMEEQSRRILKTSLPRRRYPRSNGAEFLESRQARR